MVLDNLLKPHRLRPPVCNRQHINAKGVFQAGLLIEHVGQILHIRAPLQFDDDADALFGRLVGYVHDVAGLLALHQGADIVEELADARADHGVWDLCDNQAVLAAFHLFYFHLAADLDLSAACFVNIQQFVLVDHDSPCGEVWSLDIFHQLLRADIVILHIGFDRLDHLSQIVGGDAGRHSDCNPFRPVDQKIGYPHRKHLRLLLRLVKVGHEVHDVLVQIGKIRLLGDLGQARLCITHGCSAVPFYGSEVSVPVYKDHSFFEFLGHDDQGFIDGTVSVGVVFTHGIPHDTGAFPIGPVIPDTQLVHVVERAPLNRLKPVPYIRKGPGYDDAHGIVDV